jgi:hypothetical protein
VIAALIKTQKILAYVSDICLYAHGVDVIAMPCVAVGLKQAKNNLS